MTFPNSDQPSFRAPSVRNRFVPSGQRNSRRRASGANPLVGVSLESLEIVAEHLHQAACDFSEFGLVAPGLDRFENMRLDARNLRRHRKPEVGIGAEIRAMQRNV